MYIPVQDQRCREHLRGQGVLSTQGCATTCAGVLGRPFAMGGVSGEAAEVCSDSHKPQTLLFMQR